MSAIDLIKLDPFPQPEPIILKYPVLLCHGLGALGSLVKKTLLHDVCILYRLHCISAVAPNIVPYARIDVRAKAWADVLGQVLHQTKAKKIHIVAHSMAGLDIRYLISTLNITEPIASLTTVSTPHRGSSLTHFTLNAPDAIRKTIIEISDWFGNSIYPDITSDMLGALEELSPEFILNTFNPSNPDHKDITYRSVTAATGKGTKHSVPRLLQLFNKYLYDREGENDGYVSAESAKWGTCIDSTYLSHVEQININVSKENKPEWERLWMSIARTLADCE